MFLAYTTTNGLHAGLYSMGKLRHSPTVQAVMFTYCPIDFSWMRSIGPVPPLTRRFFFSLPSRPRSPSPSSARFSSSELEDDSDELEDESKKPSPTSCSSCGATPSRNWPGGAAPSSSSCGTSSSCPGGDVTNSAAAFKTATQHGKVVEEVMKSTEG